MILQQLLDWCQESMTSQEKPLQDQGSHRAVAATLAFFPPDQGVPSGRWAGVLDHYRRPNYLPKLPFLEEWLEGTLRPTGASTIHSDLTLYFGFPGSESGEGPVAGLECVDIDGVWSEYAQPLNNWIFAAAGVVYKADVVVPLADGTATLALIPGTIESPDFNPDYGTFKYALSPIWTV